VKEINHIAVGMKETRRAVLLVCVMIAAPMASRAQLGQTTEAPVIGIETGVKAPSFRLKDQFGREQSNDTLRGTNGTVLLFFRSADW
jgi:hypothetical protein